MPSAIHPRPLPEVPAQQRSQDEWTGSQVITGDLLVLRKLWFLLPLNLHCPGQLPKHLQCPRLRLPDGTSHIHRYSLGLGREQPFSEIFEFFKIGFHTLIGEERVTY